MGLDTWGDGQDLREDGGKNDDQNILYKNIVFDNRNKKLKQRN